MFELLTDDRLSAWAEHRHQIDQSNNPLEYLATFWDSAPFVPYNRKIDPFNSKSWPTPWEIIVENKYDDFTKALMMSWTLKLTDKFKDSKIEIKTYTDRDNNREYNIVSVNDSAVLNFKDSCVVDPKEIPEGFYLENLIVVQRPR